MSGTALAVDDSSQVVETHPERPIGIRAGVLGIAAEVIVVTGLAV